MKLSGEVRKKFQMTNFIMPSNICSIKYALKSALLMLGSPMGMAQDPSQVSGEVRKKFQMTNFTMPNSSCSMKYALK